MSEPIVPVAGFQLQTDTITVSTAHQAEKLGVCGIDPQVFGSSVDPSFFIGIAIDAGIKSGISAEGNINMLQSLEQHRPAQLDEPLAVGGCVRAVTEVARGKRVDTEVWFNDIDGKRVITANRTSLRPDADKTGALAKGERGAGERPQPVVADVEQLHVLSSYTLTPERVKAYSSEGNSIHYEEAAAKQAGFRAPLIGGGMGVHFLLASLWQLRGVHRFKADIYFRRPVFWDEEVTVGIAPTPDDCRAMALLKTADQSGVRKVGTEIAFHAIA